DHDASGGALDAATGLLEGLSPSREQAIAYELRARVLFMSNEPGAGEAWAERAAALAEELGEAELALDARITAAVSRFIAGDDAGRAQLRTLREAALVRNRGDMWARDTYARVTYYLALIPMLRRRYDDVDLHLEEGRRYADEHELEYWQSLIASARLMRSLEAGRWREAAEQASLTLGARDPTWRARLLAVLALGRIKARTGQPGADGLLDEAEEGGGRGPPTGGAGAPAATAPLAGSCRRREPKQPGWPAIPFALGRRRSAPVGPTPGLKPSWRSGRTWPAPLWTHGPSQLSHTALPSPATGLPLQGGGRTPAVRTRWRSRWPPQAKWRPSAVRSPSSTSWARPPPPHTRGAGCASLASPRCREVHTRPPQPTRQG